jgi:hypothetical protein
MEVYSSCDAETSERLAVRLPDNALPSLLYPWLSNLCPSMLIYPSPYLFDSRRYISRPLHWNRDVSFW